MQGGAPRRNELRYAQYNQRLNCCTLRYCSLIEKIIGFFRRGEAAKNSRAVVLTAANRFELASTRSLAESCFNKTDCPLIFTLVPGQKWVGPPLNLLRRKLSNYVPLKHNRWFKGLFAPLGSDIQFFWPGPDEKILSSRTLAEKLIKGFRALL